MSCPLCTDGAEWAVGTSPMAWMILCTGAGAGAAASVGAGASVTAAAEIDLEGALPLASFLTSYSAVLRASMSSGYFSGIKVLFLVNCIPDVTLVGTWLLNSLLNPRPRPLPLLLPQRFPLPLRPLACVMKVL
jgi:hypothetical protein